MSNEPLSPTPEMLFGIPVYASRFLAKPGQKPREVGHADWRERLNRNLSRRSTGRWEPLTYLAPPPPSVVLMPRGATRDTLVMHPEAFAAIRNLANV